MTVHEIIWFYKIVMFSLIIFFARDPANECPEWDGRGLHRHREGRLLPALSPGGCGQVRQTGQERSVHSSSVAALFIHVLLDLEIAKMPD